MTPKISVIIVSWNSGDIIAGCLKSIRATKYPNLEIITIDNASQDETLLVLKKFKSIRLIRNSSNVGFPKAVNQGLQIATGNYILLLNSDASLPADFFQKGLSFFVEHPDAAVMGPKLVDPDGTPQGSVFSEPSIQATFREFWLGQKGLTGKYAPTTYNLQPTPVNAVSGACMFFPRRTLEKIGLFTERVFMYYEDLDYCRRIRRSGWNIYFNPQITVTHIHGHASAQTDPGKYRNFAESLIYPFRRFFHYPNRITSFQRYQTEAGIWYNGWLKHTLIAGIIWTGQKLRR